MMLRIGKNTKPAPYTSREIMEDEQQELWFQATESVKKLTEVQKRVVELLQECRKQLPTSFDGLEDSIAQSALENHIRLRSLFALSEKIWEKLEKECKALANCSGHGYPVESDAQEALQATLTAVEEFPFDSIIDDDVKGLYKIDELKDKFEKNFDFGVYKNWSFRDIIGTIENNGIKYEELWKSVVDSQDPEGFNLKDLLDDDTMERIYWNQ